jgi:hypothetical protein
MFIDPTRKFSDEQWELLEDYFPLWLAYIDRDRHMAHSATNGLSPQPFFPEEEGSREEWSLSWDKLWNTVADSTHYSIAEKTYSELEDTLQCLHADYEYHWTTPYTSVACSAYIWLSSRTYVHMLYDCFNRKYIIFADRKYIDLYRTINHHGHISYLLEIYSSLNWTTVDFNSYMAKEPNNREARKSKLHSLNQFLKKYTTGLWMREPQDDYDYHASRYVFAFENKKDAAMVKLKFSNVV